MTGFNQTVKTSNNESKVGNVNKLRPKSTNPINSANTTIKPFNKSFARPDSNVTNNYDENAVSSNSAFIKKKLMILPNLIFQN